jgi:metacaspase-1
LSNLTHALIVGVSRYKSIAGLPGAVRNDVEDVAELLRDPEVGSLLEGNLRILVDEAATADAVRAAFTEIAAEMSADGALLMYFSGHGDRADVGGRERSWLLPHDFLPADLERTALSSDEVVSMLNAVGGKRQVVMIDACHAGGVGSIKGQSSSPKGIGKGALDDLAQGSGRALLTSSRADEFSAILLGARNSVFTATLLEALGGAAIDRGDGTIGVLDVFHYVADTVPKLVDDQHPVFHAADLENNFAIARRRPVHAPDPMDVNELTRLFCELYPAGPTQDGIWSRAGGNVSQLLLSGNGLAQWHAALAKAVLGGGGLTLPQLVRAAAGDYPNHAELRLLLV